MTHHFRTTALFTLAVITTAVACGCGSTAAPAPAPATGTSSAGSAATGGHVATVERFAVTGARAG
jgi:hypothetical protein